MIHAVRGLVRSLLLLLLWSSCEGRESELNYVTCGSLVKLLNTRHNVRLHSHDVKYGSGNFSNEQAYEHHRARPAGVTGLSRAGAHTLGHSET